MKLLHYTDETPKRIDNDVAKGVSARLLIGKNDGAENFCMRIFQLDPGGHTPLHSHEWEHEIFFHQGQGEIFLGDGWKKVTEGCAAFVPGNHDHQIRNTGDGALSFVCLIPSGYPEL
ncbi:MAG: cupin domain-containing protein [Desulfobacteraceae bacterium]|jgi:quercetin dioxygenase-like cupin family protein